MNQSTVVIETGKHLDKIGLLDSALKVSGFEKILESALQEKKKSKDEFLIIIKPNLAMFFKDTVTVTDPELVESLVDWLHGYGFTNVALGEAPNIFSKWLGNRKIHEIAKFAGYHVIDDGGSEPYFRCKTPKQNEYHFFDLHEDACVCILPEEFSLNGIRISKSWQNADFRISFAKNKTHEEYVYTLCLKNLLGAISHHDKHLHYHSRLKVKDVCFELYKHFPVQFNIIDAYTSSHGNTGAQVPNKINTQTIIAGANTILVDWVGALKMGIDPYLSPLNSKALRHDKLPDEYKIIGSLKPYKGWKPVHPLFYDVLLRLDQNAAVRDFLWPATFINNDRLFPWKKMIPRLVNKVMSPFWEWTDYNFLIRWGLTCMLYFLVFLTFLSDAFKKCFFKKGLMRKKLPINIFNKNDPRVEGFADLPNHIKPLEEVVDALPKINGTCYTFINNGILYYMEQWVDIEFENFVEKMKIQNAVSTMKDFIGGRSAAGQVAAEKGVSNQVERTVYLPQPNWLAILNAKDIDVTKIERIEQQTNYQKIIWKTIFSDNDSALFDDGAVTFKKDSSRTRIQVMVHQAFQLPKIVNTCLKWTGLRDFIMEWVYNAYFKKTIANYCKSAETKYKEIGRDWILHDKIYEESQLHAISKKSLGPNAALDSNSESAIYSGMPAAENLSPP